MLGTTISSSKRLDQQDSVSRTAISVTVKLFDIRNKKQDVIACGRAFRNVKSSPQIKIASKVLCTESRRTPNSSSREPRARRGWGRGVCWVSIPKNVSWGNSSSNSFVDYIKHILSLNWFFIIFAASHECKIRQEELQHESVVGLCLYV